MIKFAEGEGDLVVTLHGDACAAEVIALVAETLDKMCVCVCVCVCVGAYTYYLYYSVLHIPCDLSRLLYDPFRLILTAQPTGGRGPEGGGHAPRAGQEHQLRRHYR